MNKTSPLISGLNFTQVAWVVKDIHATLKFFQDVKGITNFSKPEIIRAKDFDSTYYDNASDGENLTSIAYSGGTFIELIQPVSGISIFKDYLERNPEGGIHHIAYSIPVADLEKVISNFAAKGYEVISSFDHPIAKIVFFDTSNELGVFTEIMGITKEGEKAVQQMKGG